MKTDLVVAGYILKEDKVLLIHHKKLDVWLPVGGHIDENETPDQALVREIKEEIGIDVEILNKLDLPKEGTVKYNLAAPFHVNDEKLFVRLPVQLDLLVIQLFPSYRYYRYLHLPQ